ncbi:tunicamycin resistance protein [Virgibacillus profundi]|uniref:Tunicamycin resistance protein n=1 Tax=Virgibacillus profundi TaxID=2024555 RepID=A0A2A2I9M9_9BACI|nr:AAA family ATPase [Virgibacillus profundi]PAV28282.1 tunicamycin resistance protein [Virgibacillus profundi]PXY52586.1 tunicamycin resistance protein [Virgibacillus profundi]
MILWINGTFGAGKTTVAYELHRRIKNSFVYDPERLGYVFMANVPNKISKDDFQDYPLWREANYKLLKQVSEEYDGIIIVPMTLTNVNYFEEIIGQLRQDGIEVKHFTLSAFKQTIDQRLRKRLEGKNSWAHQQMDGRMKSLANPLFNEQIQTDNMSIKEVVETIADLASIELLSDERSKIRKSMDRLRVTLKEIRIFK